MGNNKDFDGIGPGEPYVPDALVGNPIGWYFTGDTIKDKEGRKIEKETLRDLGDLTLTEFAENYAIEKGKGGREIPMRVENGVFYLGEGDSKYNKAIPLSEINTLREFCSRFGAFI